MSILLDTDVFLWAAGIEGRLSESAKTLLDDPDQPIFFSAASAWEAARRTCERAAVLFPGSLHAGIDLLITTDYKRHAVLECNAFGDLLYGALHNGRDPYAAEIEAALGRPRPPV